ncbi:methylated-DNA--[protein]-cysteine S-methyltransferase [Ramlibacter sp.]|uniref:methylated-DNA--[protein]-cysteine S-methyltransferase n=1 Tax=Ramlibacter sp. TaxID=1917967 RepID=UPI003D12BBD5
MTQASGWCVFPTAIGECAMAWSGASLVAVQLPESSTEATRARMRRACPELQETAPPAFVVVAMHRVQRLLEGEHDDLADLPLDMRDVPPFHRRVYEIARAIPPGRVRTYGDIAKEMGEPGASRAVGQALGANPFAPVVPCHRILAAGGRSGGFSAEGGASTKLRMLEIERARFGESPGLFD